MNKRGEEGGAGLSLEQVIGFVLTFVFLVFVGLIIAKSLSVRACPAGYDLINVEDPADGRDFKGFCDNEDYNCCERKSDINEICRYDQSEKEFISCVDIREFEGFPERTENPGGTARELII